MRLYRRKAGAEGQRTQQARALDLEAGFGGDAARELKAALDVAVAAWLEYDDIAHLASVTRSSRMRRIIASAS